MRRSSGVHALECHVFIARSSNDATSIVGSIRETRRKYELDQETLLFNYKPFVNTEIPIRIEKESSLNQSRLSSKSTQSLFGKFKANLKEKSKKDSATLKQASTHTIQSLPSAFSTVKKTKRKNLGKRLIESTKRKSSNLGSSSDSGNESKPPADIDFRKSSIIDQNLLIDDSKLLSHRKINQQATTKIGDVFISDDNFILKTRPSSLERNTHSRLTKHQIQQINDEFNQFYNDIDENEKKREECKTEETWANHLVWNKNSRSAESLDRANRRMRNEPVARAISPGGPLRQNNLNERQQTPMSTNYVSSCYSNSSRTSTPMTDKSSYFNKNNYQFIPKKFTQQNLDSLKESMIFNLLKFFINLTFLIIFLLHFT